jgi:uncharacterized repeat protein (TIGR01451 family)
MGRIIKLALFGGFCLFVLTGKTFADVSCQPIYGGGQSCVTTNNIVVNKTVLNPQTNQFVDNLSINDPKYQPGFITTFQISVTNTGNNNISQVDVKDIFPQYVSFASGPGTFDTNANTLSYSLTNLAPNETRTNSVVGRIFNAAQISVAQNSVVCVVNQAIAMINNANVSQDNAQFCIQNTAPVAVTTTKGGFPVYSSVPVTSTPSTGPDAFSLILLAPTGLAGIFMIRYANKRRTIS